MRICGASPRRKGNISESKVIGWVGEVEVGRKHLPQQAVFSGEGDILHLDLVPCLQPILPSAGVAGSSSPVWFTEICTIPLEQALEATWSQQPEQPWHDWAVIHNLCHVPVWVYFWGVNFFLSLIVNEVFLISVSIVLILSHVSYLLQQYF